MYSIGSTHMVKENSWFRTLLNWFKYNKIWVL